MAIGNYILTKADIIDQVSQATGLTKVETEAVLDGILFSIADFYSSLLFLMNI